MTAVLLEPVDPLPTLLPRARRRRPDRRPGRGRAGRLLHPGRDRLRRDLLRPGGAPGDDLRGRADARDRDRDRCPRQRPFLRELAILSRELRPGVTDLRATLPVLNEAIEVGTPVLRRSPATTERLGARCGRSTGSSRSRPPRSRCSGSRRPSTWPSRWPSGWSRRRPSATTGTTGSRTCPTGSPTATRSATPSARRWPSFPLRADGRGARRRLLRPAGERAAVAGARAASSSPIEIPILNAHPYMPTGQRNADCQGGQFGYALGQRPGPGPGRSTTPPTRHRPARLARPDHAVHQRRRRARAPRHAQRRRASPRPGGGTDEAQAVQPPAELGDRPGARDRDRDRLVLAFTKELPWGDAYEVRAVFGSAQSVRPSSPVRIAGVNVGKVTSVEHAEQRRRGRDHRAGRRAAAGDRCRAHRRAGRGGDDGAERRRAAAASRTPPSSCARGSSSRATTSSTWSPAARTRR